jgi:chemotaxis protein histidine kinase CheA
VIKEGAVPSNTGVFQAMEGLAPENAPETPAPQVVQLVDAPGAEIDRELLEIFLEEAGEVVATIAASLATCRNAPHDRESLTTIRRGFHTLKGSGRMVGLMDLGEMAWQCEQVMNKWLKDEKPASASLFGFIELARSSFEGWVGELKAGGAARIESTEITRQAELLKSGQEITAIAAEPARKRPWKLRSKSSSRRTCRGTGGRSPGDGICRRRAAAPRSCRVHIRIARPGHSRDRAIARRAAARRATRLSRPAESREPAEEGGDHHRQHRARAGFLRDLCRRSRAARASHGSRDVGDRGPIRCARSRADFMRAAQHAHQLLANHRLSMRWQRSRTRWRSGCRKRWTSRRNSTSAAWPSRAMRSMR